MHENTVHALSTMAADSIEWRQIVEHALSTSGHWSHVAWWWWCLAETFRAYYNVVFVYFLPFLQAGVCCVLFVATQRDGSADRSTTCNVISFWFFIQLCFYSSAVILWSVQHLWTIPSALYWHYCFNLLLLTRRALCEEDIDQWSCRDCYCCRQNCNFSKMTEYFFAKLSVVIIRKVCLHALTVQSLWNSINLCKNGNWQRLKYKYDVCKSPVRTAAECMSMAYLDENCSLS